jgi:hypothetical protein
MSWWRASAIAVVVVAVAFAALVIVPNAILSQLSGLGRGGRVALATGWFFAAVVAILWVLRRLQARELAR